MLKKYFSLFSLFMVLSVTSFAQTTGEQKATQPQTIEQLQTSNPKEYKALMKYAEKNGSIIMDIPKGKNARFDGEVTLEKAELVDPVKMGFSIPSANAYYRITGTEKMVMVKSLYTLQQEMKNSTK